jgi:mannose-6-phosphate isomerase-like protein (cupin superfamily)
MIAIKKSDVPLESLPGRGVNNAIGKGFYSESGKMSVGFCRYSEEFGPMQPHHHAEEAVYVVHADRAYVAWGGDEQHLANEMPLEDGMLLHFPELEWHVFRYDEGGSLEIIFIYGQVDNIRPEQNTQK